MARKKPLTPNSLMAHLRNHGVQIKGSRQKRMLRNMGYYHGYKGYRFVGSSKNKLPITDFNQVAMLYAFDMQVKTIMYPCVMHIETALKNRTLEAVTLDSGSAYFEDIWKKSLTAYREAPSRGKYSEAWDRRQNLRGNVDALIYKNSKNRSVISHFKEKDEDVPVWALFEVMTLGDFGSFFNCLNSRVRGSVVKDLGMPTHLNSEHLLGSMIFALKDLRNAIAHNATVYDVRFQTAKQYKKLTVLFAGETGVKSCDFTDITDYVVMLVYLMKVLGFTKTDCRQLVDSFERALIKLKTDIGQDMFEQVIRKKAWSELRLLREYIKR